MSNEIIAIPHFKKEIKKLSKKYPSLKDDFAELVALLQLEPIMGTALGNNCYKIRLAISSKGKENPEAHASLLYLSKLVNSTRALEGQMKNLLEWALSQLTIVRMPAHLPHSQLQIQTQIHQAMRVHIPLQFPVELQPITISVM
jgi:hypothetical protein